MNLLHSTVFISISILALVSYYKFGYFPRSQRLFFSLSPLLFYFVFASYKINYFIKFLLLSLTFIIEIAEAVAFYTTHETFSILFFSVIDIKDAYTNLRSVLFLIICITFFVEMLVILNIAFPLHLPHITSFNFINIPNLLLSIFFFAKFTFIYNNLFRTFSETPFQSKMKYFQLIKYIVRKPQIVAHKPAKNLVYFVVESFELQNLGAFNHEIKTLMPFLSSLAINTTVFTNIVPQPLIGYSMASFFCTMCGFPIIFTPNIKYVGEQQGSIQLSPMFNCIPDILHSLNYSNYFVMTGNSNWGNLIDFVAMHKYKLYSAYNHSKHNDRDTLDWISTNIFPKLKTEQPFFLTFESYDTHNGRMPNLCFDKPEKKSAKKRFFNEYDCLDVFLKKFIYSLKSNGLYDNTEIIIYGDHFFMGKNYNFVEPRSNVIILPKHKLGNISLKTSFYDMTHLILHLLGIKKTPPFPFGDDPFGKNYTYSPPSTYDISMLKKLYSEFIQPANSLPNLTNKVK